MNKIYLALDSEQFMILFGLLLVESERLKTETPKDNFISAIVNGLIEEMEAIK